MERDKEMEEGMIQNVSRGEDGFIVPDGYFARLQDEVLKKVVSEEKERPALSVRIRQLVTQPAFAYAALVTGMLIAVVTLIDRPGQTDVFAAISADEAYEYVYQNIDAYSATEIASMTDAFTDDDLSGLTDEEVNIALDDLLKDMSTEDLDELF